MNRCFNNGTCIQNLTNPNSPTYFCSCSKYHRGSFCESKIDICQNETCSGQGRCFDIDDAPKCVCFKSYEGDSCQIMSESLKLAKKAVSITIIVAIIIIVIFYLVFIFNDLIRIFVLKGKFKRHHLKWNNRIMREIYNKKKFKKKLNKTAPISYLNYIE